MALWRLSVILNLNMSFLCKTHYFLFRLLQLYEQVLSRQIGKALRICISHSFCLFSIFFSYNTFIHTSIRRGSILVSSLLFAQQRASVPNRDSNLGLPYSKPTHYNAAKFSQQGETITMPIVLARACLYLEQAWRIEFAGCLFGLYCIAYLKS